MEIQLDSPELVAARHFFNEPTVAVVCVSSDVPKFTLADDFNCDLFAAITVPDSESRVIRLVLESIAKTPSTHPVLRRVVD